MTTLLGLNPYQSEALIVCLAASVVWAGALLIGTIYLERRASAGRDRLWVGALLLAVLPSLVAPTLAALGVSLRPAPVEAVDVPALSQAATRDFGTASRAAETGAAVQSPSIAAPKPAWTPDQAIQALALLYIYGAALAFFIWALRQIGFLIAVGLAKPVRNKTLLQATDDWAFEFGVKAPALKNSRHVSSVCIYGAVSPVILLPYEFEARVAQNDIALMCAHEIAHLKRGDTRLFTATALARVLFWFNPLVTRIAANVELSAEEGADRLVIGSGVDRRAYASCFVKGLKYAAMKQSLLPAMAPSFTPSDRQGRRRRLDSILTANTERSASIGARAALAGAASIAALLAVGQAAFAVDPEVAAEKRRQATPASTEHAAPAQPVSSKEPVLAKPVDGDVSLPFGRTFKSLDDNTTAVDHQGVDIKAAKGAPVKASADGGVVEASSRVPGKEGYGTLVIIDHGHGMQSRYAHLDSYKVKVGQSVRKGDIIGAVGETGRVTGPHLHFEVLKNGEPVDPVVALAPPAPEPPAAPEWADGEAPVAPVAPAEPVGLVSPAPINDHSGGFSDQDFQFAFEDADGFAFANGDKLTDRMAADMEHRLLGDLDGAAYDLEFSLNGNTHRFTSDTPMTPEKRAALRAAIDEMKVHRDAVRKEWRKDAEKIKRAFEKQQVRLRREFKTSSADDPQIAFWVSDDSQEMRAALDEARRAGEDARREALEAEREALEAERETIEVARADLEDSIGDGLDEALDELDRESQDIEADREMTENDRRVAELAFAQARRDIERARAEHQRQIENARRNLERRATMIERKLNALDQANTEN